VPPLGLSNPKAGDEEKAPPERYAHAIMFKRTERPLRGAAVLMVQRRGPDRAVGDVQPHDGARVGEAIH
jgi:hypothetical protein